MMFKEINEEAALFDFLIKKYVKDGKIKVNFPVEFKNVKFVASGSSYNCARLGQKFLEQIAHIQSSFEYSSEFNSNQERPISKDILYFFISQSGETYDTKVALDFVKSKGGKTFALVNNDNSYIFNTCDHKMNIESGVEKSIAATKSFTGGVLCLWLIALKIAQNAGVNIEEYLKDIKTIKEDIETVVNETEGFDDASSVLSNLRSFPVIGYGYNYVIAKEGALKIKETSYIDVNAYPTGEFLHGHTAILNESSVILEVFTHDMGEFERKTLDKIKKDYAPKIVAVSDFEDNDNFVTVKFKRFNSEITRILALIVVMQLLALKIALKLNRNVDSPKGLNKVVGG